MLTQTELLDVRQPRRRSTRLAKAWACPGYLLLLACAVVSCRSGPIAQRIGNVSLPPNEARCLLDYSLGAPVSSPSSWGRISPSVAPCLKRLAGLDGAQISPIAEKRLPEIGFLCSTNQNVVGQSDCTLSYSERHYLDFLPNNRSPFIQKNATVHLSYKAGQVTELSLRRISFRSYPDRPGIIEDQLVSQTPNLAMTEQ